MKLVFFYLSAGSGLFLYFFYDSFYYAGKVYFFSYLLTPLAFIATLYIFLLTAVFLLYKTSVFSLRDKGRIYELSIVHLLITFSLVFISQYTYSLFLQFFYPLLVLDFNKKKINNVIFLFYLFLIHYALVLLFTSNLIVLYFIDLLGAALLIYRQSSSFSKLEYLACGICIAVLLLILNALSVFAYDIYIWLDIVDAPKFINSEVLYVLSLLHIFLFFFIEFKKK